MRADRERMHRAYTLKRHRGHHLRDVEGTLAVTHKSFLEVPPDTTLSTCYLRARDGS